MADMIPIYLVACWIFGGLGGYIIGRFHTMKKVLTKLDALCEGGDE